MEAGAGFVAGSHNRHELVVIRADGDRVSHQSRQICQICGDDVDFAVETELFVACNECAFPVCRPCYEYERREGNKSCPQCKTRYKRHKGSPRVEGDEEEDDTDNHENEFNFQDHKRDQRQTAEAMLHARMSFGRANNPAYTMNSNQEPLRLTNGEMGHDNDHDIPEDHHATVIPPLPGGGGKRVHPLPYADSSVEVQTKLLDSNNGIGAHRFGNVWKERVQTWRERKEKSHMMMTQGECQGFEGKGDPYDIPIMDEARQPLSRKVSIQSSLINPYRMVIVIRLVVLGFFFHYRLLNPVRNAYPLWLTSVICEIWFAISWILDQFPKWFPITRETYLDRLSLRYEPEGEPSQLAAVDIFVSTVDPMKEPPLVTANTVLSILSVDYPVDKVTCYVSDDGASMLTFDALSETSEFARKWVPFCKKFNIEPRAPEACFAQKIDYLKDKVQPSFVKERRAMKREYEEFKIRINSLVAKAQRVPEEGWQLQDNTPWPGNNTKDHPAMIQVFLGHNGGQDMEGKELPRLVYVSREKRLAYNHHKKAGAMNALIRVSAVLTNAPYILNLDCDHYVNNSQALREAMCFMMDPTVGTKVCYVQFPQKFDGIDQNDRYANHNTVFFDINLKGLDGIQGPVYVGTGCVFRRQALYGYDAPYKGRKKSSNCCLSCCGARKKGKKSKKKGLARKKGDTPVDSNVPIIKLEDLEGGVEVLAEERLSLMSEEKFSEAKFGKSPVFIESALAENGGPPSGHPQELLKEAIHVISCGYEDRTQWGAEIGWIYGSVTEDILTGFKMHSRGWRSIYCMPQRPAFKGSAPINLTDRLQQVLRWALGSVEIFLSKHCPIWYGYGGHLKWLQRLAYINTTVYPLTSLPLVVYCVLPAVCLATDKFIIPEISNFESLWFISLFLSIFATGILEMRWSGVGMEEWWRNEQFWVIGGVSSHLFALFQGLLKVLAGIDTNFTVTSKSGDDENFGELYIIKWTSLMIPPTTILILNVIGIVAGISNAINNGYGTWGPLFGKLFFAFWVIVHLYPFLKGLMGRHNRTPTIVIVWSILLASIISILWVRIDPFLRTIQGPSLEQCGINC